MSAATCPSFLPITRGATPVRGLRGRATISNRREHVSLEQHPSLRRSQPYQGFDDRDRPRKALWCIPPCCAHFGLEPAMPQPAAGNLLSLPPPRMTAEALLAHVSRHWGLQGTLAPLTSERDLNHRLSALNGRYTIKLTNPAEPEAMTDFQTRALLHAAQADRGLPTPRLVPLQDGDLWLSLPEGRLRVLTWLDGTPLAVLPRSVLQARSAGAALARLTRALAGFDHAAADHVLLWDIQHLPRLLPLVKEHPDPAFRAEATAFLADFTARVVPALERIPRQVCHADFNPHNLLADPAEPDRITGVIDFGDMVRTPRICDLAIAAAYQVDPAAPLPGLAAFLSGYTEILPLSEAEIAVLFDLIVARMIATLTITGWRAVRYPENAAYILRNAPSARAGLDALASIGREAATRTFTRAARTERQA